MLYSLFQVANSNVRQNALYLLLDLFPFEDPDATKETKDALLDKQFYLLERMLMDDCPDIRVVAVEGSCRILHLFWEIIPSPTITKIITKIFDSMSHDICNEVRLSTLNGIIYLLGNPQSHEILKVLLPRFGHLILDNVLSIRVAMVDLLLVVRDIRNFQFNKVYSPKIKRHDTSASFVLFLIDGWCILFYFVYFIFFTGSGVRCVIIYISK